jgi:hypothetical protein
MSLQLTGELRNVVAKKAGESNMRQYQILSSDVDKERLYDVDDFDLNRKIELKKEICLDVYVTSYTAKNGSVYIQYHAIKGSGGNGSGINDKKGVKV